MTECERLPFRHRKICAGDLRNRIMLHDRDIRPVTQGVDFDIDIQQGVRRWSGLRTVSGVDSFAQSNSGNEITHIFYVRYKSDITSQKFLSFKGKYYVINGVENIDERDEYFALYCYERGTTARKVNFS